MAYNIIVVAHIFSVIAWMSGLLYLPRIFAYHAQAILDGTDSAVPYFQTMERKLYFFIMYPAMAGVWLFGMGLMTYGGFASNGWLHVKISLVLIMTGLHFYFGICYEKLLTDGKHKSPRFYKIINEVPAVILIIILVLVVLKPF